jgi:hypothetical protein
MRLFEFDQTTTVQPAGTNPRAEGIVNLLAILNVVIEKATNEGIDPSIPTDDLIAMVRNTGVLFDYNALLAAYESNQAVKNMIKSFSKETVDLIGSSEDEIIAPADAGENSGEAISKIAKRVANRSIGK